MRLDWRQHLQQHLQQTGVSDEPVEDESRLCGDVVGFGIISLGFDADALLQHT